MSRNLAPRRIIRRLVLPTSNGCQVHGIIRTAVHLGTKGRQKCPFGSRLVSPLPSIGLPIWLKWRAQPANDNCNSYPLQLCGLATCRSNAAREAILRPKAAPTAQPLAANGIELDLPLSPR